MSKRLTDTEIWDKEWFMELKPKLKCLVKFVRDKCDLSGVWHPNYLLTSTYIGENISEPDLLNIDGGKQFQKLKGGKIFCCGFIDFQNGQLKNSSPVHKKIISLLEYHNIPYIYPMNRVLDSVIVEVGVKVKEEVNINSNTQIETIIPEKPKIEIPELPEFLDYAKQVCTETGLKYGDYGFTIITKYETWIDNGWKDGNGSKIKNWKLKFKNTLPYLKPIHKSAFEKKPRYYAYYEQYPQYFNPDGTPKILEN